VVTQELPGIPIWINEIGVPLGGEIQPREDDSSFYWEEIAAYSKAVYAALGQGFGQQGPVVVWFAWSSKMAGSGIVDAHDNPTGPIHRAFFETVRGIARAC
jgi:hypothetical protein